MTCFHRTDHAAAILRDGFVDGEGSYGFVGLTLRGVWISDEPLDVNEGAEGTQLLALTFPEAVRLDPYEIHEEMKTYREWCVPAEVINSQASAVLVVDEP